MLLEDTILNNKVKVYTDENMQLNTQANSKNFENFPVIYVSNFDEDIYSKECDDNLGYDILRNCDKFESKRRRFGVTSAGNPCNNTEPIRGTKLRGSYSFSYGKHQKRELLISRFSKHNNDVNDDKNSDSDQNDDLCDVVSTNDKNSFREIPNRFRSDENGNNSDSDVNVKNTQENDREDSPQRFDSSVKTDPGTITSSRLHGNNSPKLLKSRKISNAEEEALWQVKETATRLRLHTRRPSYQAWKEQYIDNDRLSELHARTIRESVSEDCDSDTSMRDDDSWTRINESLSWLRHELTDLRAQDKIIARKLLNLHNDIQEYRLQKACESHVDMLEDLRDELEGLNEICDLDIYDDANTEPNPIKHIGVTKLNLSERRFSTC